MIGGNSSNSLAHFPMRANELSPWKGEWQQVCQMRNGVLRLLDGGARLNMQIRPPEQPIRLFL
jgi:hypothetical protein